MEEYSTREAGRDLGVSRQRVHQLLSDGLILGQQDPVSGRWRIDRRSVVSYLQQRATLSHPQRLAALEALLNDTARRVGGPRAYASDDAGGSALRGAASRGA